MIERLDSKVETTIDSLAIFAREEKGEIKRVMANYTSDSCFDLRYLLYRVWNTVKAIFGQSDWQLLEKTLNARLYAPLETSDAETKREASKTLEGKAHVLLMGLLVANRSALTDQAGQNETKINSDLENLHEMISVIQEFLAAHKKLTESSALMRKQGRGEPDLTAKKAALTREADEVKRKVVSEMSAEEMQQTEMKTLKEEVDRAVEWLDKTGASSSKATLRFNFEQFQLAIAKLEKMGFEHKERTKTSSLKGEPDKFESVLQERLKIFRKTAQDMSEASGL